MEQNSLTEVSRSLTQYQRSKLTSILRVLWGEYKLAEETDLGASQGKKRLIHFSGKKLKALLAVTNADRDFLIKLLNLLEKEAVLLPTGVISAPFNEKEEEIYGRSISVLLPANFEEQRLAYERKLEQAYQENVRASISAVHGGPSRKYRPRYDLDIFSIMINILVKVIGTPLALLYTLCKDVASFTYKFLLIPLLGGAVLLWVTGTWNAFIDWLASVTTQF